MTESDHTPIEGQESEDEEYIAKLAKYLETRTEIQTAIDQVMNQFRAEGCTDEFIREAAFQWLCENSESRDNFEDEAEEAANEHDWPDEDEEDEDDED
jgi:hypothetical protein